RRFTGSLFYRYIYFSSRRRHTKSKRDWSSDVCSSDLVYILNKTTQTYRWLGGIAVLTLFFVLYRNKMRFSGWYKGKDRQKLAKKIGRASCREREGMELVQQT